MNRPPPDIHLLATARPGRVAHAMRALGRATLPEQLDIPGGPYHLTRTVKHDFFAATGFYANAAGHRAVLKIGRTEDFAGLPLRWLGRLLCQREMRFYRKLADLPNIPRLLGTFGDTGFVHEYIPGRPLSKDHPVPNGFFDRLHELMGELHRRGIAYVDTNKPQNILLGDDGLPYLIDFQISWDIESLGGRLNRWCVRRLQHEDLYHCLKHKRRLRPDELTDEEKERAKHRSVLIRLHRFIFKPYFRFRRTTFKRLRQTGALLPEGSK